MPKLSEANLLQVYESFFANYMEAGQQWLSIFEIAHMTPQTMDGKIVLWVRDWLNYLDGIALLYNNGNTYAAKNLLRSCWEIYLQFKFFLKDIDPQIISDKLLCIELVELYKSISLQNAYYHTLLEKGQAEDADFLKQYLEKSREIYAQNQLLNKDRGEHFKEFYEKSLKQRRNYKWYGLYLAAAENVRINNLNALSKKLYTAQGSSLGEINRLIYSMLSSQAHGCYSREGYYKENGQYKLMPLRHLRGAGLVAVCVQVMFEDILATLDSYFQGRVEVFNPVVEALLVEQKKLVALINVWDKELTCLNLKDGQ